MSLNEVRNSILPIVRKRENASEDLGLVPYEVYGDVVVEYYCPVYNDKGLMVTNALISEWGTSAEEIHSIAFENAEKDARFYNLSEKINAMFGGGDEPKDVIDFNADTPAHLSQKGGNTYDERGMYILTNASGYLGACTFLSQKILGKIGITLESDFYILPSSIHEVLVVSANVHDKDEMVKTVREINRTEVAPEERLSDSIFIYRTGEGVLYRYDGDLYTLDGDPA